MADYITFEEVQEIDETIIAGDEAKINILIPQVQAEIERKTKRKWLKPAAVENKLFDPNKNVDNEGVLHFEQSDWLESNASLVVTNGDGVAVAADEYVLVPDEKPHYGIKILGSSGKSWVGGDDPEDSIDIEGYFSYKTAVPADMKLAMIRDVLFRFRTTGKGKPDKLPGWVTQTYNGYSQEVFFA